MRTLAKSLVMTLPLMAAAAAYAADRAERETPKGPVTPLVAAKGNAAPKLDANPDDPIWKKAQPREFKAVNGFNFKDGSGNTQGTLQAAYVGDMFYMLLTYDDPTQSFRRSPYQKQPDGSWKKLSDPNDKGGDNNVYYEDKFAFIWNINDSILGFNDELGCNAACHRGEKGKPYGNKYTEEEGEIGDIWHMKSVRVGIIGQIDDQFLDHTRFDPQKSPEAGRKSDAKTGGGYTDVKLVDGKPEFMSKDGKAANKGGTYWIKEENKVAFDDSKFQPGDEVASIMVAPFTGDRGDIKVAIAWKDGKWYAEIARKLTTGSKTDVQFSDLGKTYGFGVALFDNAQVRHAYTQPPILLTFEK